MDNHKNNTPKKYTGKNVHGMKAKRSTWKRIAALTAVGLLALGVIKHIESTKDFIPSGERYNVLMDSEQNSKIEELYDHLNSLSPESSQEELRNFSNHFFTSGLAFLKDDIVQVLSSEGVLNENEIKNPEIYRHNKNLGYGYQFKYTDKDNNDKSVELDGGFKEQTNIIVQIGNWGNTYDGSISYEELNKEAKSFLDSLNSNRIFVYKNNSISSYEAKTIDGQNKNTIDLEDR